MFPQGCRAFRGISPNVEAEESGMRDDSGMQDVQYTEVNLLFNLQYSDPQWLNSEWTTLILSFYGLVNFINITFIYVE